MPRGDFPSAQLKNKIKSTMGEYKSSPLALLPPPKESNLGLHCPRPKVRAVN